MTNETVVADGHELAYKAVGLDTTALSNVYISLNFNEGANETVVANSTPIKIYGARHGDVLTEINIHNTTILERNHLILPPVKEEDEKFPNSLHDRFRLNPGRNARFTLGVIYIHPDDSQSKTLGADNVLG